MPAGDEDGVLAGSTIGGSQEGASEGRMEDRFLRGRCKMANVKYAQVVSSSSSGGHGDMRRSLLMK